MPKAPIQIKRSNKPRRHCTHCGIENSLSEQFQEREMVVRGEELIVSIPRTVCSSCGVSTASLEQADQAVAIAVTAFQINHELLTGAIVLEKRKEAGLTQKKLAKSAKIGVASIKRLESGVHVLNQVHNDAILRALEKAEQSCLKSEDLLTVEWTAYSGGWSSRIENPQIMAEHSVEAMAIDDGSDCNFAIAS